MPSEARIANDHVPLAFLLGNKARHYSVGLSVVSDKRHHTQTSPRSIVAPVVGPRAIDNAKLFAPGAHVRHREEQARRCLRRVLGHEASGTGITEEKQSRTHGTLLVHTASSLKKVAEKVLDEVAIMREEDEERPKQQPNDDDNDQTRAANQFHSSPLTFLDVSGRPAAYIPLPSMTKANTHKLTARRKNELRAVRAQQLHALLEDQQMHTKELLKKQQQHLHELTSSNSGTRHVARVDLAVDADVAHGAQTAVDSTPLYEPPSLAAIKQQQQEQQQMLHERVQDRKHLETLTRQQKLAFYQQQKRTFGRIQSKRPSFLATLQLDKGAHTLDHSQLDQPQQQEEAGKKSMFTIESAPQQLGYLSPRRKEEATERRRDDSNDAGRFLEKQQCDTLTNTEGVARFHFGGGFMAEIKKAHAIGSASSSTAIDLISNSNNAGLVPGRDERLLQDVVIAHAVAMVAPTKKKKARA